MKANHPAPIAQPAAALHVPLHAYAHAHAHSAAAAAPKPPGSSAPVAQVACFRGLMVVAERPAPRPGSLRRSSLSARLLAPARDRADGARGAARAPRASVATPLEGEDDGLAFAAVGPGGGEDAGADHGQDQGRGQNGWMDVPQRAAGNEARDREAAAQGVHVSLEAVAGAADAMAAPVDKDLRLAQLATRLIATVDALAAAPRPPPAGWWRGHWLGGVAAFHAAGDAEPAARAPGANLGAGHALGPARRHLVAATEALGGARPRNPLSPSLRCLLPLVVLSALRPRPPSQLADLRIRLAVLTAAPGPVREAADAP
jgi:hypothetical protein